MARAKGSPSGEAIGPEIIERLQAGVAPALALLAGMQLEIFTHLAAGPWQIEKDAAQGGIGLAEPGDEAARAAADIDPLPR